MSDQLEELAAMTAAMLHGRAAFEHRLDELGGGFPSQGAGGSGWSGDGGPTAKAVVASIDDHRSDVGDLERRAWERDLSAALRHAGAMWERYQRLANVRLGVEKVKDPGCDLCSKVPCGGTMCPRHKGTGPYRCETIDAHWCPVYASVEITEDGPRNTTVKRTVALCSSCYEFARPDRAGRLPTHEEVLDHAEGRRRRWRAGA